MNGLVIWAQSDCRSMMGVYAALIKALNCPVVVALWFYRKTEDQVTNRNCIGLRDDEFSDIPRINVGEDWNAGKKILDEHPGFTHLFAVYQVSPNFRALILEAKKRGEKVFVISESPCNMMPGFKGWLKEHFYLKYLLPRKVKDVIRVSEKVFNLSGDSCAALQAIGWPAEKIVPFGYFSPPLPGSECVKRTTNKDFHILVTGIMQWHRAPDTVMRALVLLKKWGVPYRATFTQKGPLLKPLKQMAIENGLPVTFSGFLPMPELIKLYETCSVYVAAGRREPWGMRLNDALQCGAPIAVSRGMGGVQMVDDLGCGVSFGAEDYAELAHKLRRMIEDESFYLRCADNAWNASEKISSVCKAGDLRKNLEMIGDV